MKCLGYDERDVKLFWKELNIKESFLYKAILKDKDLELIGNEQMFLIRRKK